MIIRVFSSIVYFALGLVVGSCIAVSLAMTTEQINSKVSQEVVRVETGGSYGTGFAVKALSGRVVIVTNNHVCDSVDGRRYLYTSNTAERYRTRVLGVDAKHDLCAIDGLKKWQGLPVAPGINLYDGVHVLGHPHGYPIKHSFGFILGRHVIDTPYPDGIHNMDSYRSNVWVAPGSSGSPVVSSKAEVVAVVYAVEGYTSWFIPGEYLKAFLARF